MLVGEGKSGDNAQDHHPLMKQGWSCHWKSTNWFVKLVALWLPPFFFLRPARQFAKSRGGLANFLTCQAKHGHHLCITTHQELDKSPVLAIRPDGYVLSPLPLNIKWRGRVPFCSGLSCGLLTGISLATVRTRVLVYRGAWPEGPINLKVNFQGFVLGEAAAVPTAMWFDLKLFKKTSYLQNCNRKTV